MNKKSLLSLIGNREVNFLEKNENGNEKHLKRDEKEKGLPNLLSDNRNWEKEENLEKRKVEKWERMEQREIDNLKESYYGRRGNREEKKRDRKLNFEWDEKEDTTGECVSGMENKTSKRVKLGLVSWKIEEREQREGRKDVESLRETKGIRLKNVLPGERVGLIESFEESILYGKLKAELRNGFRFSVPTAVQQQVLDVSLRFRDLLCVAPTGSGKTLAYLLPLVNFLLTMPRIRKERAHLGPYALVVGPTRELVLQIKEVFDKLAGNLDLRGEVFVGGYDSYEQNLNFLAGREAIFATVGKCRDLLRSNLISLKQCCYVVVDEADKMMENEQKDSLDYILESCDRKFEKSSDALECEKSEKEMIKGNTLVRVTQFFSATFPEVLKDLLARYLKRFLEIQIQKTENTVGFKFEYFGLKEIFNQKLKTLVNYLQNSRPKILVFFNTKSIIEKVQNILSEKKIGVLVYSSDLSQKEREKVVEKFRTKEKIMLSTDIAGRGLDIDDLFTVINFDLPLTFEKFEHRAGRTGRAGKKGEVVSFVGAENSHLLDPLTQFLKNRNQPIPHFLQKKHLLFRNDIIN